MLLTKLMPTSVFAIVTMIVLTVVSLNVGCRQKMRVIVPNATWEPIFFRQINSVTVLSGQRDLRTTRLPKRTITMNHLKRNEDNFPIRSPVGRQLGLGS